VLRHFFDIGANSYGSYRAMLVSPHSTQHAHFSMGCNVGVVHDCELDSSGGLKIGNDVWISEGVFIATHGHRIKTRALRKEQSVDFSGLTLVAPEAGYVAM
jgi:acetyltransferase-like isoleucine patch superfamily enzyme